MSETAASPRCSGCGLEINGGEEACNALFQELTGRSFTDVRFGGVHRKAVDIYALQHPGRYCVSAKSLAAHLCGLCELVERNGNPAMPNRHLREWLDGTVDITKPKLPTVRGDITIARVMAAKSPTRFRSLVDDWGSNVWAAYAPLHSLARQWLDEALTSGRRR